MHTHFLRKKLEMGGEKFIWNEGTQDDHPKWGVYPCAAENGRYSCEAEGRTKKGPSPLSLFLTPSLNNILYTVWSGVSFICNAVLSPREYDFEYEVNTYQQTQITYFI